MKEAAPVAVAAAASAAASAILNITRDGRTLFFREGESVYSVSLSPAGGGGAGGGGSAGIGGGRRGGQGGRRRINFVAKVRIDKPAEWAEMFDDAWRTMKYRFYDPQMHGMDWDAARAKYQPLVAYVGDRQELLNIINEMIGELNASHTGAAPASTGREGAVSTGHLGLELEADEQAGRYRVTHVYEDGPADKDWVKVNVGDYLIAINGKPVKAGDELLAAAEQQQPSQPQGRSHVQQQTDGRRRVADAHRADFTARPTASFATNAG